jgi:hypothetical protein
LAADYTVEFETVRLFGATKDVPAGTRVPGGELAGDQRGLEYLLRVGAVSAVAAVDEGQEGPKGPDDSGEGAAA